MSPWQYAINRWLNVAWTIKCTVTLRGQSNTARCRTRQAKPSKIRQTRAQNHDDRTSYSCRASQDRQQLTTGYTESKQRACRTPDVRQGHVVRTTDSAQTLAHKGKWTTWRKRGERIHLFLIATATNSSPDVPQSNSVHLDGYDQKKSHALKILIDFAYRCQHTFVMSNLSTWGWAHKNTRFKNKILQLIGELSPRVQKTRESQSSLKDLRGLCPLPPASLNVSSKHFVKHLSRQHILSDLNEKAFWREKVSQEDIHAKCSYSLCCISAMQQTWSSMTMSILGNTKIQLVLIQPLLDVQNIRK